MARLSGFDFQDCGGPRASAGFTDEQLVMLSSHKKSLQQRLTPWPCWESENSSYGKTFRQWAGIPGLVPLFINSCHGAHHGSRVQENEADGRCQVFFGWPSSRIEARLNEGFEASYLVQHPWVSYRKRNFREASQASRGLLYFYPHSNFNWAPRIDEKSLRTELEELSEEFGGVTICLNFHDVRAGLHERLRPWGFPLVTAGDTTSSDFVDRFYELIYSFEVTASSSLGSQVYFCIEAGLPHLITDTPTEFWGNGKGKPLGVKYDPAIQAYPEELALFDSFESTLRKSGRVLSDEIVNFVNHSLAVGQGISPSQARRIIWRELRKNFPKYAYLRLKRAFPLTF